MFDRYMMGIGEFDCKQKVGGTRYLSDFGQTEQGGEMGEGVMHLTT